MRAAVLCLLAGAAEAFHGPVSRVSRQAAQPQMRLNPVEAARKLPAAAAAASVSFIAQAASAKTFLGVNGALDFGNLATGVGGEGTGRALGVNDDALVGALFGVVFAVGYAFVQWSSYQDDDDDFFDTYDSRREDREITNRNRV